MRCWTAKKKQKGKTRRLSAKAKVEAFSFIEREEVKH